MNERASQVRNILRRDSAITKLNTVEAAQNWLNKQGKPRSPDRPYRGFNLDEQLPQPPPDRKVF